MHTLKYYLYVFILLASAGQGCKKDKTDINQKITPNDFLSNSRFDNLLIEIQCVNGTDPTTATIDNLKAFMGQRLNKPGGITVIVNHISSPGKSVLSLEEVRDIEKNNRSQQMHDGTLTAYFLFVDADYSDNDGSSKVLGVAYSSSSMVIFEKTVKEFSGGIGKPSVTTLESTVSMHEFGHILGLCNNGTSMQTPHQDEPHGKHCNNNKCLMYWEVENSNIVSSMMGGTVHELDAQCLADLKGNGGK
jgi:hypothetical protein